MSSHRHTTSVQLRSRQWVLGIALTGLSVLTACAGPPLSTADKASVKARPAPAELDQDPIDPPVTKVNIAAVPPKSMAAPEESDMTVLVLEDRDLLALASRTTPPANLDVGSVKRPEVSRFQFAFDAHRLDPEAEAILRQHGRYLVAHPDQKVHLTGHTDTQGAEAYNRFLSRLRATAAARILKEEGVRDHQIELVGVGSDQPIAPGNHAENRRLELSYESRLATSD
jgi:peptidoglycan-associated lipoprotein